MTNPANEKQKRVLPPGYKPLSAATRKLEVPKRDGYQRRWFNGNASRIGRALLAGWTFVERGETEVNSFDIGGDASQDGNTDLGTRVSIISGEDMDRSGQPGRMYLMEIEDWLYDHGREYQIDTNKAIARSLREGNMGTEKDSNEDRKKRYLGKNSSGLTFFTSDGDDNG